LYYGLFYVDKVKTLRALPSALCCAKLSFDYGTSLLLHLARYKPHEHEVCIKVFGLAFYKKQAGVSSLLLRKSRLRRLPYLGQ
jgi:hypothetical protein